MKRLLVYDTFEAHVTDNAKAVFAKENSNLALIFFFKVQSKIGVRIIHGRALYKGKYGKY